MNAQESTRLLAFSGSSRRGSFTTQLLHAAVAAAHAQGAAVTVLDMKDWPLPLYDGDLEAAQGVPATVLALRERFADHRGWLIASPEYNGFFSPLVKNTIDWLSRPVDGLSSPFAGKVAAVLGASPGALGGIRMLPHLRLLLSNLGVTVTPGQLALSLADRAFADGDRLRDPGQQSALENVVSGLLTTVNALSASRTA